MAERKVPGGGEVSGSGAGCWAAQMLPSGLSGWVGCTQKGITVLTLQVQAGLGATALPGTGLRFRQFIALGALCRAPEHRNHPEGKDGQSTLRGQKERQVERRTLHPRSASALFALRGQGRCAYSLRAGAQSQHLLKDMLKAGPKSCLVPVLPTQGNPLGLT